MRKSKFMTKARASGLLGTLQGLIDFVYERAHTACNNKELACPRGGCDACALSDIKELTESTTTYKKTTIIKQTAKVKVKDLPVSSAAPEEVTGMARIYNKKRKR